MPKDIKALIENTNRSSYSAQIGSKNQQTIKLSLEDNKSQNKPIKGIPMPKEIKERIEQMKRQEVRGFGRPIKTCFTPGEK